MKQKLKSLGSKSPVYTSVDRADKKNKNKRLQNFDLNYSIGKSCFGDDGSQNYLECQPVFKFFTTPAECDRILGWKSKGLSEESFKPPIKSDKSSFKINFYS